MTILYISALKFVHFRKKRTAVAQSNQQTMHSLRCRNHRFGRQAAEEALTRSGMDVAAAAEWLLSTAEAHPEGEIGGQCVAAVKPQDSSVPAPVSLSNATAPTVSLRLSPVHCDGDDVWGDFGEAQGDGPDESEFGAFVSLAATSAEASPGDGSKRDPFGAGTLDFGGIVAAGEGVSALAAGGGAAVSDAFADLLIADGLLGTGARVSAEVGQEEKPLAPSFVKEVVEGKKDIGDGVSDSSGAADGSGFVRGPGADAGDLGLSIMEGHALPFDASVPAAAAAGSEKDEMPSSLADDAVNFDLVGVGGGTHTSPVWPQHGAAALTIDVGGETVLQDAPGDKEEVEATAIASTFDDFGADFGGFEGGKAFLVHSTSSSSIGGGAGLGLFGEVILPSPKSIGVDVALPSPGKTSATVVSPMIPVSHPTSDIVGETPGGSLSPLVAPHCVLEGGEGHGEVIWGTLGVEQTSEERQHKIEVSTFDDTPGPSAEDADAGAYASVTVVTGNEPGADCTTPSPDGGSIRVSESAATICEVQSSEPMTAGEGAVPTPFVANDLNEFAGVRMEAMNAASLTQEKVGGSDLFAFSAPENALDAFPEDLATADSGSGWEKDEIGFEGGPGASGATVTGDLFSFSPDTKPLAHASGGGAGLMMDKSEPAAPADHGQTAAPIDYLFDAPSSSRLSQHEQGIGVAGLQIDSHSLSWESSAVKGEGVKEAAGDLGEMQSGVQDVFGQCNTEVSEGQGGVDAFAHFGGMAATDSAVVGSPADHSLFDLAADLPEYAGDGETEVPGAQLLRQEGEIGGPRGVDLASMKGDEGNSSSAGSVGAVERFVLWDAMLDACQSELATALELLTLVLEARQADATSEHAGDPLVSSDVLTRSPRMSEYVQGCASVFKVSQRIMQSVRRAARGAADGSVSSSSSSLAHSTISTPRADYNPPREKDRERDREKEREQHKALQTLGAQLQDLMRNGLNVAVWFAAP